MGVSHALYESTEPYYPAREHGPVDFEDYLYKLEKERAAGALRARANGFQPPVNCLPSAATAAS